MTKKLTLEEAAQAINQIYSNYVASVPQEESGKALDELRFLVDTGLSAPEVVNRLKAEQVTRGLDMRAYASEVVACSTGTLSEVYNGKRLPGKQLLKHIGITEKRWR